MKIILFSPSSIVLGCTRPFSNMLEFYLEFLWGIFVGIFSVTILWYFCEVLLVVGGGGVYMVPLAYDNGMVHAIGAGIPAPSDAIDVCVSKHQSALIGGDGGFQLHCRAQGLRT